jgi:hypothetical protein
MKCDPNNFNDFEGLQGILQRDKILKQLEKNSRDAKAKKRVSKTRQCPWCGGELAGKFAKCQNCGSDLDWVLGYPCKPEDKDKLERKFKADEDARRMREEDIAREQSSWPICSQCNKKFRDLTDDGKCRVCNSKVLKTKRLNVVKTTVIVGLIYVFNWDWLHSIEIIVLPLLSLLVFRKKGPLISSIFLVFAFLAVFISPSRDLFYSFNRFLFRW